jgi:L-ascorbate metabolism protein UlaG (beta-lactamase superfamily)
MDSAGYRDAMVVRLVRNATLIVEIADVRLLVDPMFNPAGAVEGVRGTPNPRRNPTVELPMPAEELVAGVDAVLVTHLHNDHFDAGARELLDRGLPIACQPADAERLRQHRFRDVRPVDGALDLLGVGVARTDGRHGTGELGEALGPVSGFVLRAPGEPPLYIAGDTIWCDEVDAALAEHAPDVVVVNASGARFLQGDPIVMTIDDVLETARAAPTATVIVVHLEAISHALDTRAEVRAAVAAAGLGERVVVPEDGERLEL